MNIIWSKLVIRLLFWLSSEIFLGVIGCDDLADSSEFARQKTWLTLLG